MQYTEKQIDSCKRFIFEGSILHASNDKKCIVTYQKIYCFFNGDRIEIYLWFAYNFKVGTLLPADSNS